ncbi:coagulation factor VII-like isoform 2-T2 [Menidia menidia]
MKPTMWLRVFVGFVLGLQGCQLASVFLDPQQAHGVLVQSHDVLVQSHGVPVRRRRYNSGWLEELQKGDLKRECVEEKCTFEEAREVFEHTELTKDFWKTYSLPNSCESSPCQNSGTCLSEGASYTCLCLPQFRGLDCELEPGTGSSSCLLLNGGCQHFCEEDAFGRRLRCSCADGYQLDQDGRSCAPKESIACGMVPVLQNQQNQDERLRIVGGTECPKGECPWQVLLVYKGKGFCGGVIVKPTWILTAAHCLENTDRRFLKVVAGEHNIQVNESTEQLVPVAEVVTHESYSRATVDHDIALLRLATPLRYGTFAVPVCLPTRLLAERELWAVRLHTVSGWGRRSEHGPTSNVLRRTQVPRMRTQTCVEKSGVRLTPNMFCAGYPDGRTDSCRGDSGGPLVTEYRGTAYLLGIVSWGRGCAQPGNYGIYTRVSNYLQWVQDRIQDQVLDQSQDRIQVQDRSKDRSQDRIQDSTVQPQNQTIQNQTIQNQTIQNQTVQNQNHTVQNQTKLST